MRQVQSLPALRPGEITKKESDAPEGVKADDERLKQVAQAWPRLRESIKRAIMVLIVTEQESSQ